MKKKFVFILICVVVFVFTITIGVLASSKNVAKNLSYNNIRIMIDNEEIKPTNVNGEYVEPFILDGTTYLPVRGIASALGLDVEWDSATNTVKLYKNMTPNYTNKDMQSLNVDEFCKKISGVWVDMNSRKPLGDDMSFGCYIISNNEIYYAVYPGGGDRPGKIINIKEMGNGEYTLKLIYPEGWFMGDYYNSKEIDFLIKLENETIIFLDDTREWPFMFMGKTIEEAKKMC